MSTSLDERELTAYHEASHAVLAYITGMYVVQSINTADARVASTAYTPNLALCAARMLDLNRTDIDPYLELSIICAAGAEGERRLHALRGVAVDEAVLKECARGDVAGVERHIGEARWQEVCDRAAHYLRQPGIWAAVVALAGAVVKSRGELRAAQVDDILHEAAVEWDLPDGQVLE